MRSVYMLEHLLKLLFVNAMNKLAYFQRYVHSSFAEKSL